MSVIRVHFSQWKTTLNKAGILTDLYQSLNAQRISEKFQFYHLEHQSRIIYPVRQNIIKDKKQKASTVYYDKVMQYFQVSKFMSQLWVPPCRLQWCCFCSWCASIATPASQGKVKVIVALLRERWQAWWSHAEGHAWPISCQLNHPDLSRDQHYVVCCKPVPGSRIKQQLRSLLLAHPQALTLLFKGSLRLKPFTFMPKLQGKQSLPHSQISPASGKLCWGLPKKDPTPILTA